jgi:hypothetical protein
MTEVAREQVRAYIDANDDFYDRLRHGPATEHNHGDWLGNLRNGLDVRKPVESAKPSALHKSVQDRSTRPASGVTNTSSAARRSCRTGTMQPW